MHQYTEEQIHYLRDIALGRSNKEITEMFNKKFNLEQGETAISSVRKRYRIKTGWDGKFGKGNEPWNKGMKGLQIGGKETQFKKGNRPHNYRPIGSERVNAEGYLEVKVADPKKWKCKHVIVWEEHNGKVPKGHAVIFGDGSKDNFDIDNLILVSRKQLLKLNQYGLIKNDADLTRTGVILTDLYSKINERKNKR